MARLTSKQRVAFSGVLTDYAHLRQQAKRAGLCENCGGVVDGTPGKAARCKCSVACRAAAMADNTTRFDVANGMTKAT